MKQLYIWQVSIRQKEIQNEHIVINVCKKGHRHTGRRIHRSCHGKTRLIVDKLTCGNSHRQYEIYHKAEYKPQSQLLHHIEQHHKYAGRLIFYIPHRRGKQYSKRYRCACSQPYGKIWTAEYRVKAEYSRHPAHYQQKAEKIIQNHIPHIA